MATTTTNLGLTKPAGTEAPDISVINTNMDLIDTAVGAIGTRYATTFTDGTYAQNGATVSGSLSLPAGKYLVFARFYTFANASGATFLYVNGAYDYTFSIMPTSRSTSGYIVCPSATTLTFKSGTGSSFVISNSATSCIEAIRIA